LSQLYNLTYGSDTLTPEEGDTVEAGFRQRLLDKKLAWDITAWRTQLDDVVLFDYSIANPRSPWGFGQYANGDKQRTSGAELNGSYALDENWTLHGNYTYTDSHTQKVGGDYERTVQVARNIANAGVSYRKGALEADIGVYYTGPRLRWAADLETDSYVSTNFSARYNITKSVSLYGRIENLFDEDVVEEIGYQQPGRYTVVGAEYRFF
jgi:outer membrane receptor protein involved in Fe transport